MCLPKPISRLFRLNLCIECFLNAPDHCWWCFGYLPGWGVLGLLFMCCGRLGVLEPTISKVEDYWSIVSWEERVVRSSGFQFLLWQTINQYHIVNFVMWMCNPIIYEEHGAWSTFLVMNRLPNKCWWFSSLRLNCLKNGVHLKSFSTFYWFSSIFRLKTQILRNLSSCVIWGVFTLQDQLSLICFSSTMPMNQIPHDLVQNWQTASVLPVQCACPSLYHDYFGSIYVLNAS